jgi:ureidoacrylate peracid hydrolase
MSGTPAGDSRLDRETTTANPGSPTGSDPSAGPRLRALTLAEKVDPARTALLVIDVQNDYIHPDGYIARIGGDISSCVAMVPRLLRLVDAARSAGISIVHTRNWHRPATDSPAWLDRLARGGRTQHDRAARAETWGAEFYQIVPLPGEEIVSKFRYDAFLGTNLEYLLRARGIRTVICIGTATNICVESTARAALMRDFHLVMVEDCCASPDEDLHRATLKTLKHSFGEVTTADQLEAIWRAGAPSSTREPAAVLAAR